MAYELPDAGAANELLAREIPAWWLVAAEKTSIELAEFDASAPLDARLTWAASQGLVIGTVYTRFSSKRQHSTQDQVRTNVQHAAARNIYCPPEFVCVDEATRGYRARRDGLERMLCILKHRYATVLLVFKASRLFRQAFKGYQLIQQEVVEEGLRAISVTQGIDTADTKAWRMLFQVHGMVDDMVVEATADHVRAGLKGLFARGYTVGAIPVGYNRAEIEGAPLTNRSLPRTEPEVDSHVAEKIVEHYEAIRDGETIRKGWKKWVAEGLPADPRSSNGYMTYNAYHRMLSRIAYTGRWEFGRKRNEFSTKRDYARQIPQPDSEVEVVLCEDLRIVEDELFYDVQKELAKLKTGPRGPKKDKPAHLWDLVTSLFKCAHCQERFYQAGANGKGMQCKNGGLCPRNSTVRRKDSVRIICNKLCELINQDAELIEQTICAAQERDTRGDDQVVSDISELKRTISNLNNQISDLYELAGLGSDADRKELMARVRSAQTRRSTAQADLSRLQATLGKAATITEKDIRNSLVEVTAMLETAAGGDLGPDAVYKAVAVFRDLVGGQVDVHVERRAGRKQSNVRCVFRPILLKSVPNADLAGVQADETNEVSVWLREPPLRDRLAPRVHQLMDVDGHSYRSAAKVLQTDGYNINSGVVWQIYRRYYEMTGKSVPKRPYNNGNKRRPA